MEKPPAGLARKPRARRLADTQTQQDVIEELRAYAGQLDHQAVLFEQQAAEFARLLNRTRQLADEVKGLSTEALARLQDMAAKLKKNQPK